MHGDDDVLDRDTTAVELVLGDALAKFVQVEVAHHRDADAGNEPFTDNGRLLECDDLSAQLCGLDLEVGDAALHFGELVGQAADCGGHAGTALASVTGATDHLTTSDHLFRT